MLIICTVQLRYKQITQMRIIRVYFAYTRMSIRAHICIYMCTYARTGSEIATSWSPMRLKM